MMVKLQLNSYRAILQNRNFRAFWSGFLIPIIGTKIIIGLSSVIIGAPGLASTKVKELIWAGGD